jgi:hypothetical protein
MNVTNEKKIIALTFPAMVGYLILAYDYACPGLARLPTVWNEFIGRGLFTACFLGGAVTSFLGLVVLQSCWEKLGQMFKAMFMLLNLGWLGAVIYLAVQMHELHAGH